jgi:hypothetical protein
MEKELVDRMMVKCARRCCICRRFNPTKLQVHHIVQRSEGGTDDEDNLIVTCITCHSDIHSQVPFARRFSVEELKGHRDALIKMLEEGKLPRDEQEDNQIIDKVIKRISDGIRLSETEAISPESVQLLLASAHATGERQGIITIIRYHNGLKICPGNEDCPYNLGNRRNEAKYKAALEELQNNSLVKYISDVIREVTNKGYLLADEIASTQGQAFDQE